MIQTVVREGKTFALISDLKGWDRNPRDIKEEDFERLKIQLKDLGQYKPLLIEEDGTVLGGNMRLKAYKAMEVQEVWISIVKPQDEKERVRYALSDNDNVGYYVEDKLLALISEVGFNQEEMAVFKIDMSAPVPMEQLLNKELANTQTPTNTEINMAEVEKKFNCICPSCKFEFEFEFKKQ